MAEPFRRSGHGFDVVLELSGAPAVTHWGAPLGDIDPASLMAALDRPLTHGGLDRIAPIALLPEHGAGFFGAPGLQGRRGGGRDWAPSFDVRAVEPVDEHTVLIVAADPRAELEYRVELHLEHALTVQVTLTNRGSTRYLLDQLLVTLPLPDDAREVLSFTSRWTREFHPARHVLTHGAFVSENRTGRSSLDATPLVFVGQAGFGEWHGSVWGVHVASSANHTLRVEVLPDGRGLVQAGELLHPGEVVLEPGESYTAPAVVAVFSDGGLTPATWGFHRLLRTRAEHPSTPRKVLINTWEAVYFDHDPGALRDLVDAAAALGVERFVLDDGWFGARRHDRAGLGDWTVSPDAHPDGLAPLIDHVHSRGMDFGIWVEPEMVNPDSDLYRAHPDWALADPRYDPVLARHQLVLDLARPDAYAHVRDQLHALLRDHRIAYVKWDMNRHHVRATGAGGSAGTRAQTQAVHRLLDELRSLHPDVEFESCSSGGGRVDLGMAGRTERVWTSDSNDALERQTIQRGTSMLLPPEMMGAHIGPPRAHTSGRTHSLAFRAVTAMFGHLGIEWDVRRLGDSERADLAALIALHQRFRPLLHRGDAVRFDVAANGPEPCARAYGVYAVDRSEALVCYAQLRTGMSLVPPVLRLPGLTPDARYRVVPVPLPLQPGSMGRTLPRWITESVVLTGRQLAVHGLQPPTLAPESIALVHLVAEPDPAGAGETGYEGTGG